MIYLNSLFLDFNSQTNTSQNGWWRPELDFERAVNDASLILWNRKTDEAEKSQRIIDELRPFLISKNIIVQNQNSFYGTFSVPPPNKDGSNEYARFASARILLAGDMCVPCKDVDQGNCINGEFKSEQELADDYYDTVCQAQIEKIDNQRWPSVLTHLTRRPTLQKPKLTQINNMFQVAPRQVSVVIFNYYIKPKYATFKYTLTPANLQNGSGDVIVYDQKNSTPLEWPETVKNELLDIIKDVYIGYTRDSQFQQINASQKQTA